MFGFVYWEVCALVDDVEESSSPHLEVFVLFRIRVGLVFGFEYFVLFGLRVLLVLVCEGFSVVDPQAVLLPNGKDDDCLVKGGEFRVGDGGGMLN